MRHWGKPAPEGSKFPVGVGKTIYPQELEELDRQADRAILEQKAAGLKKMPIVEKPN